MKQLPESDSAILAPADKLVEPVTDSKPEEKTTREEPKKAEKKKIVKTPRILTPGKNRPFLPNFNQSFIAYMQEGEDPFKRQGNPNIRPALEELKLLNYQKNIIRFLNGACAQARDSLSATLKRHPLKRDLIFDFTIKPDGNIAEINILQSSGAIMIDEAFKDIFKAAAPFPKLPASQQGKPLTQKANVRKDIVEALVDTNSPLFFHMYD